jgi:segregation and condensation protein B
MEQPDLKAALESLLFVSNRPLTLNDFARTLDMEPPVIQQALDGLLADKKDHGIILLESNGQYQLSTNSKHSTIVKNFLNAELREKLTEATVEVLAIIAYRQPISKAEIEAIRGVNSQYSVRNLLMRGLIEKIPNPRDARSFLYQTTTEFLQHLGLTSVKDLPEFDSLVGQIKLPQTPGLSMEAQATSEDSPADNPEKTTQPEGTPALPPELQPEQEQNKDVTGDEYDADEDEDDEDKE